MFNAFRRKSAPVPTSPRPRAILSTHVTEELVVLSKAGLQIRDTYEIRLAMFMAVSRNLRLVLAVRPGAKVDAAVVGLLEQHGGQVQEANMSDFSVYIGRAKPDGSEDGWVLGDGSTLQALTESIQNPLVRQRLAVGSTVVNEELAAFREAPSAERVAIENLDGENVHDALLTLIEGAKREGGTIFVQ